MEKVKFQQVNLEDPFFTSLKEDYNGFEDWFQRKSDSDAYIQKKDDGELEAFLYLKIEEGVVEDVSPKLPEGKHLKVGTFKMDAHNTKLCEYFIQMIMRVAVYEQVGDIYVTIFEKHEGLVNLLKRYGFELRGTKGNPENPESVYVKSMTAVSDDLCKCFPFVHTNGKNKYMLSVYPGDILVIYRTNDGQGPAYYRSVATSICVVEEVKRPSDFKNLNEFIKYTNAYSIFDEKKLRGYYFNHKTVIIKMTYNAPFNHRLNRQELINGVGLSTTQYWGFFQLTDKEFNDIVTRGQIDESIIVD